MKSPSPSQSYGDGAFLDRQPRLTDLIPKKYSTLLLLFLGGVAVVAGLEGLYAWMPRLASMTKDGRIAAFDLDGEGSLAMWFSSATLALAQHGLADHLLRPQASAGRLSRSLSHLAVGRGRCGL